MRITFSIFPIVFSSIIALTSCQDDRFETEIPSYIRIDEFHINDSCYSNDINRLDIVSHKITDAWVFIDGALQGTYELPVTFPVIEEGTHTIEVRPGILKNGISATRAIYPFYEFYKTTATLTKEKVLKIEPCTDYRIKGLQSGNFKVAWQEDFENVIDFTYSSLSDVNIETTSEAEDVLEGNFAGAIILDETHDFFEAISPTFSSLPVNGIPIYLEINYKTNQDFWVGIYTDDKKNQIRVVGFRQKSTWNKVYVDLTDAIRFNSAPNYNIYFGFVKDPNVKDVEMYIDNLKLLHF